MPTSAVPSLLVAGDLVLDRYRVLEQIAAGGHSLVFRGEDIRLARPVCIKVFSGLGGKSGVGRTTYEHFVQEAFALSRLTHPNTLRIYDFGHLDVNKRLDTGRAENRRERNEPVSSIEDAGPGGPDDHLGLPLQVCEYMNGGTLSSLLREKGPQSIAETMRIAKAMCEALAEAHDLGIVHRDIKPQNILFASVGDARLPKLADFGIAKWSADQEGDTAKRADDTQIVAGQKLAMYSPSWAAPEQLAGQPVGPGTDIYSLAALVVYMLTSKAIFSDEDVYAGYKKRRHWDPLVRDALLPLALPPAFVNVLAHALSFDPKTRIPNIAVFAAELSKALAADPMADLRDASVLPQAPPEWLAASAVVQPVAAPGSAPVYAQAPGTPSQGGAAPAPAPVAQPEPEGELSASHPASRPGDPLDRLADGTRYRVYGGMPSGPPTASGAAQPMTPSYAPPAAPAVRQAWFSSQPAPSSQVHRLGPSELPIKVGDRRLHFVMAPSGIADLMGPENARVRLTILPAPDGRRIVHIKSLSCFVAHHGGRPSPAIHCDRDADVELVTPRAQPLAFARMTIGHTGSVETPFLLGAERITVARDDLADPILFDFGPGSDAYLVYTQGRPAPRLPRRQ
ncbi:MAG: serine/threonine protein kinase [Myxococcales bacterium]|nr:serine/threonine protein kinase [Myxococcales bacterium]